MCLSKDFWLWVTEVRISYVEGLPGIHIQLKAILQKTSRPLSQK